MWTPQIGCLLLSVCGRAPCTFRTKIRQKWAVQKLEPLKFSESRVELITRNMIPLDWRVGTLTPPSHKNVVVPFHRASIKGDEIVWISRHDFLWFKHVQAIPIDIQKPMSTKNLNFKWTRLISFCRSICTKKGNWMKLVSEGFHHFCWMFPRHHVTRGIAPRSSKVSRMVPWYT